MELTITGIGRNVRSYVNFAITTCVLSSRPLQARESSDLVDSAIGRGRHHAHCAVQGQPRPVDPGHSPRWRSILSGTRRLVHASHFSRAQLTDHRRYEMFLCSAKNGGGHSQNARRLVGRCKHSCLELFD